MLPELSSSGGFARFVLEVLDLSLSKCQRFADVEEIGGRCMPYEHDHTESPSTLCRVTWHREPAGSSAEIGWRGPGFGNGDDTLRIELYAPLGQASNVRSELADSRVHYEKWGCTLNFIVKYKPDFFEHLVDLLRSA